MKAPQAIMTKTLAGLAFLFLTAQAWSAYLEQDYKDHPIPPPERIIPPPPARNEICELVARVRVGRPYTVKNLTVFPLQLAPPSLLSDYMTLDDALSRGYIEILEEERPDVRSVLVRNNSRHHIFLMAGEAIGGGKQNRLISEDVLLAPHGRPVRVPVYCIEKGRWSEGRRDFGSGKLMAPSSVRGLAQEKASQRALWDRVSGLLAETGTRSENENLAAVYDNEKVAGEIASFRRDIRIPFGETVGCVVVVNGRISGADVFTSPELFRKLWEKLLDSYAVEAIARRVPPREYPEPWPSEHEIRRFLDQVFRASFRDRDARDVGRIVEIAGPGIGGEGLLFRREVVHVHLTPQREVRF